MSALDPYDTVSGPFASQEFADAILGPLYVGAMVNLVFWGVAASSFLSYTSSARFTTDTWRTKTTVYAVMVLATLQSSFDFWLCYHYGTCQQRDADTLISQTVVDCFSTFWVGFEAVIVQGYLANRASLLFKKSIHRTIFFVVCGSLITVGFVGAMLYMVLSFMYRAGTLDQALPLTFNVATSMWLCTQASVDIIITVALVMCLKKAMVGFREETDSMLRSLIKLAIFSASYTALFATVSAILTLSLPEHSLYSNAAFAFPLPLSSFYALSLLMNLSQGSKIREKGEKDLSQGQAAISTYRAGGGGTNSHFVGMNSRMPQISVVPVPVTFSSYEMDVRGGEDLKQ